MRGRPFTYFSTKDILSCRGLITCKHPRSIDDCLLAEEPGTGADYVEVAEDVSRSARSAPLCQILALEELHELWNCQGSVPPSIVLLDINSPLVLLPATLLQLLGADHQVHLWCRAVQAQPILHE